MSDKPKIIRVGAISIEDIEKVIGKIQGGIYENTKSKSKWDESNADE